MKKIIVVNSETLGRGDEKLGLQLMDSFLLKLCESGSKPDAIVFYNSGVKLLAQGSPVTDTLEILFGAGVDIIACGTCVSAYQLNDKIAVGRVSNMPEIVSVLVESESVITV